MRDWQTQPRGGAHIGKRVNWPSISTTIPAIIVILFFHHRAFPGNKHIFYIAFAHSHAVVLYSVYFYRISLTLHSVERMAGAHVHFAPCLLMFSIRWYPDATSSKWHTNFAEVNLDEMTGFTLWIWLVVAPMACFMCHTVS